MNENERKHAQALILAGCRGRLEALSEMQKISHDIYKDKDQNTDTMRAIAGEVCEELERLQKELHDEAWGRKVEVVS